MNVEPSTAEDRVLVLAPTGRDALLISRAPAAPQLLHSECHDVLELSTEISAGAGMPSSPKRRCWGTSLQPLLLALQAQPAWSDFPMERYMR